MASVLIFDVFWVLHGSAYSSSCCSGLCCCDESSFCKDYFFNYHSEISLILPFFFCFSSHTDLHAFFSYVVKLFWFIFPWSVLVVLVFEKCFVSVWSLKICCARNFPKLSGFPAFRLHVCFFFFFFLISPLSLDLSYFTTRTVVLHLKSVFHYKMSFTTCCK